ncbi:M17 family peptidase N-terminal domain-containing protein [Chitinophaga rhizophila]|uniref:Peptidase M17 n=1 Tax=Chitinophaga rhizophila TaxID=2866212 RepID=A0ABS7G8R1_9BACT|nr:M17 family peptidase N-terminal domain-containing protein [Chitinophaga rhizophila]MBW8683841.1 peptidase M17 [Chitinophaga rhizophila]
MKTVKTSLTGLLLLFVFAVKAQVKDLPAIGTSAIVGKAEGIAVEVKVTAPSAQETPLQIACVFEYTEGDITNPPALPAALNGMLHVDEALHGMISYLRKSGKFSGHAFETLLITPPAGTLKAKQLLLIGLGDRNTFNAQVMYTIGAIGMREALKLGVPSYSHASNIKDAGIDSPTAEVAENVVKGALDAYNTQVYLKEKKMSVFKPVTKFTLLSGPAFYGASSEAVKHALVPYQH